MSVTRRIRYYDIAKGLGIIFVVIGHIDSFYSPVREFVISFHMALFLLVSGMLIHETGEGNRTMRSLICRKFLRIMVPYYLFSFLAIGLEAVRLTVRGVSYWPHYRSLILTTLTLQGNSVMWFLPALFFSTILFLGIRKLMGMVSCVVWRKPVVSETAADVLTLVIVLLLAVFAAWINIYESASYQFRQGNELYDRIHEILSMCIRSLYCTGFICIGYHTGKYVMPLIRRKFVCLLAGTVLLIFCWGLNLYNPKVDLRALYWGEANIWIYDYFVSTIVKSFLYMTGALSGALGVILVSRAWDSDGGRFKRMVINMLMFFGSNSLIIMATHLDFHVLHLGMEIADLLNTLVHNTVLYHGCLLIATFCFEAVLIGVINRFAPVLTGKFKK